MLTKNVEKVFIILSLGMVLVLGSLSSVLAAIEFDSAAIEAEIAAAVADGADPEVAAKTAVANAVEEVVAANPDYPGGEEALNQAILDALGGLNITGLDVADMIAAANHGLGIEADSAIEAYEAAAAPATRGARPRPTPVGEFGPNGIPPFGSPT